MAGEGLVFADGDEATLEESLAEIAAQTFASLQTEPAAPSAPVELPASEVPALTPLPVIELEDHFAELAVALPAALLLVDEDVHAAAHLANRLVTKGYACRVAAPHAAASGVESARPDLVLLAVSSDEMRADGGTGRAHALGLPGVPVLVLSSAVAPEGVESDALPVVGRFSKPYLAEDLVRAIERARERWSPKERPRGGTPQPRLQIEDTFGDKLIRAIVSTGEPGSEPTRGRVRGLSETGVLTIEASSRLVAKKALTAELKCGDGRATTLTGRVGRADREFVVIELEIQETQRELFRSFIEEARTPGRAVHPIRILIDDAFAGETIDDAALEKTWIELQANFDDEAAHQRFIQECIRAERLELAIQRYRELKAVRPDDARVAKYLLQIGTILGFKAFSKKEDIAKTKLPRSAMQIIVLVLVAALGLLMLALTAARR